MKNLFLAAAAVSFAVPGLCLAGGHEEGGPPPPGVVSKINLTGAGLLIPFYANSQKGVTAGRGGQDGTRVGTAGATGLTTGYQHQALTFIPSISLSRSVQGGAGALTFGIGTNITSEEPNQTQNSTDIPSFSVGYENFANPMQAWSITATFEDRTTVSQVSPVETGAESVELRFAYVRKLSDSWGIANQTYFTTVDSYVTTPGGTTTAKETEVYTQVELVGSFDAGALGFLGDGWILHPTFGVSYQTADVEEAGSTETNTDGSVWAKAVLAKDFRPGIFVPNVTLGLEHVYQSTLGTQFLDEDTYAILGVGGTLVGESNSFNVAFERRQGLNGNRISTTLVTGVSFDF